MRLDYTRNLGGMDRALRIIAGVALLALGSFASAAIGMMWLGILWIGGLAMLIEGALGY